MPSFATHRPTTRALPRNAARRHAWCHQGGKSPLTLRAGYATAPKTARLDRYPPQVACAASFVTTLFNLSMSCIVARGACPKLIPLLRLSGMSPTYRWRRCMRPGQLDTFSRPPHGTTRRCLQCSLRTRYARRTHGFDVSLFGVDNFTALNAKVGPEFHTPSTVWSRGMSAEISGLS